VHAGPDAVYCHGRCPELELTQRLAVIRASVSAAAGTGCGPRAGLAIAPQGIVGFSAGALGARLAARMGIRWLLVLTNGLALFGFLVLTQLPATGGYSSH
jgi:hypothetical protein